MDPLQALQMAEIGRMLFVIHSRKFWAVSRLAAFRRRSREADIPASSHHRIAATADLRMAIVHITFPA
ncbi:hypothetical protein CVN68_19160 [Sphingomonas psychrotolerans]|uniref:Uncharacterized protein n=1 Tax=Sphingomonas psychrotolerans TaxID=1327635 RepID=A0A2K8MIW7_9SPHN|nr:hypothetical protein CVN68_19160 [Sphingomonas psychrotolerans]